jgi:hypothetical protein
MLENNKLLQLFLSFTIVRLIFSLVRERSKTIISLALKSAAAAAAAAALPFCMCDRASIMLPPPSPP